METRIAHFQKKEIRKTIHQNEWWFVITDVVAAIADSTNPTEYLKKMRMRDPALAEAFKGGVQFAPPCLGVSDRWRSTETSVLEYRGYSPSDPVHPQSQGRAFQALAGQGGL